MKEQIAAEIQRIKEMLFDINDFIYKNPELGNEEYKAVEKLTSFLKLHSFEVEYGIAERLPLGRFTTAKHRAPA